VNGHGSGRSASGEKGLKGIRQNSRSLKRLLKWILKDYKWHVFAVMAAIILSALSIIAGTLFIQRLIDDYIKPMIGVENADFAPLAAALAQIGVVFVIGTLCAWLYNRIMVNVSQGTLRNLRNAMFSHMQKLPIRYFDTNSHGNIMSVYTNDVDTLRQMIGQSLPQLFNSIITLLASLVSMLILDIPLTIITLLMVVAMVAIIGKVGKLSAKYFVKQQSNVADLNGYIEEMISGQRVVKVFSYEKQNLSRFEALSEQLRDSANHANANAIIMFPISGQMANLSYVICALVGAVFAVNGYLGMTLGTLVAFLALNRSFNMPLVHISQQLSSVVQAAAGAQRIFALLDEEPEQDDGHITLANIEYTKDGEIRECDTCTVRWAWKDDRKPPESRYTEIKGEIVFKDVDFSYVPGKTVLHDINLYGMPGQKIAFVGSTGAGKTTITNLINRFYDIEKGQILYDGVDVKDIRKADLRRSLGIVLQDTHLFTGTILENIRYGNLQATDEECMAAAELANATDFIRHLPDGFQTVITGDGGSLSQGQRQLLAIARAAVSDPPVLILDEATSSIDTRTERLVQEGMDNLMYGRTTFVIAHRLSTVRNSDAIMVLEQGRIIERGTHDQLIEKQGRYYQLYTGNACRDSDAEQCLL
jgi:ATP-binding cassette subfamily B multidrug efflux pump